MTTYKKGILLHPKDQETVLRQFVHRFTGNHKPDWSKKEWRDGKPYPLQFKDDQDWLLHTEFIIGKDGRLDHQHNNCSSHPTWPFNPELR